MLKESVSLLAATTLFSSAVTAAAENSQDFGQNNLDTSSQFEKLSGPLSSLKLPAYDGPVAWSNSSLMGNLYIGASLGGLAGIGAAFYFDRRSYGGISNGAGYLIAGAGAAAGAFLAFAVSAQSIEFQTQVESVGQSSPGEYVTVRSGKTRTTSGPYYPQIITIPEINIPLAARPIGAPFIEGQIIKVDFRVDRDGQIIGWSAEPAARPSN